ncbi:MAG: class I SAM-dependent methyltransferase [Candidatus Binataceae bacterium]
MDPALYPRMAEVEDTHWWFASRRAICEQLIAGLSLPADAEILEPGCGTGGNFAMLTRHGRLYAMDADESACEFSAARDGGVELARGWLPDRIPFGDRRFDLVLMTDVLEHIEDDAGALAALRARLKPGGWLLLTVPALQWLWSGHDVAHHHRRRYRARALNALLSGAGFTVCYQSYFNFVLFPIIAGVRWFRRLLALGDNADLSMPPAPANALLRRVFSGERHVLRFARMPVGVSLIALARNL